MTSLTDETRKKALVMRLKRIEGQLRGIQNLIESGSDCEAVAQQMSASRKALDKAFFTLVGCVISQGDIEGYDIATMLAKFA